MSTKFLQATNKNTGAKTMFHDDDNPAALFLELAKKNAETGETMADWDFERLNFRGEFIEKYDWRNQTVYFNLGDLFG